MKPSQATNSPSKSTAVSRYSIRPLALSVEGLDGLVGKYSFVRRHER